MFQYRQTLLKEVTTKESALRKIENLKDFPLVEVTWLDAARCGGWGTVPEIVKDPESGLVECQTVGRLIVNNKKALAICQTINNEGQVGGMWTIPRAWIKRLRKLK